MKADRLIDQVLSGIPARAALEAIQRHAIVTEADLVRRQTHADKRRRVRPLDQQRSRAATAARKKHKPAYQKGIQKYQQSSTGKSNMRKLQRYNQQGRST